MDMLEEEGAEVVAVGLRGVWRSVGGYIYMYMVKLSLVFFEIWLTSSSEPSRNSRGSALRRLVAVIGDFVRLIAGGRGDGRSSLRISRIRSLAAPT